MGGTRDVLIAGGGIIGLSLAVELAEEGLAVTVVERDVCMRGASWAAAGMLAAEDPHNPAALIPLAKMSRDLYTQYLARVERLSRMQVPLRTQVALQESAGIIDETIVERLAPGLRSRRFEVLYEASLDPRDLCAALPIAVRAAGVEIIENATVTANRGDIGGVKTETSAGTFDARYFVDCRGAASEGELEPRKGQMLAVEIDRNRLKCVVRTADVYLVPRGDGRVLIGATVERGVRDNVVHEEALNELIEKSAALFPEIVQAKRLDSWARVRPGTADNLPVMGATAEANCFLATGHFRNGILLAPATARVMAQLLVGGVPDISLEAFSPLRFVAARSGRG